MEIYLSADLYEAAFLITYGAQFKRVHAYYKNHEGKAFSIIALEGVTFEMLEKMYSSGSTVIFAKFREYRRKLKHRIDEYSKVHSNFKQLSSDEIYRIHKTLKKQYKKWEDLYKSPGPKRVMKDEKEEDTSANNTITISQVQNTSLGI